MNRTRLSQIGSILLSFLLFALSVWAIAQELQKYNLKEVWGSLSAISTSHLLLAVGLTGLNYVMLTGYDVLALRFVRHRLPYCKTALASTISYGVSNSIGLALLSGSAIRYRFYRNWGLSNVEIAQVVAFCNLSFWLGLFAVGGVFFLIEPVAIPSLLHLPFKSVHPIGILFVIIVLTYLLVTVASRRPLRMGKWVLPLPHLPLSLGLTQIAVTSFDWILAAAVLYVLMSASVPLSYPGFFGIYLLAQIAGIISNVPGGLGVFETVMLLLLSPPIPSAKLFGALLVYRGIYYLLPLIVSVLLLSFYEMRQRFISRLR
jgi:glycosyltransferase 2 family protein